MARSVEELNKVKAIAREIDGVTNVVSHVHINQQQSINNVGPLYAKIHAQKAEQGLHIRFHNYGPLALVYFTMMTHNFV